MKRHSLPSRRSFLKTLGTAILAAPFVTSDLLARSPNSTLRHASFGAGGMALGDLTVIGNCKGVDLVAICDVDLDRTVEALKAFPKAKVYRDWRELLDKEDKNLDSVNVSTPDHMHAPIAVSAMQLGKHVYGQKPLAHNIYEVRRMTEIAQRKKLVTQMGIQIHSAGPYRTGVRVIQDGVIGKIKEVHSWCPKSWGDTDPLPQRSDPVPANLDWDLWLGVCAKRPFIGGEYYHPFNWRKRLDFGTGTFGDMGCHIFDPVFGAIGLTAPLSVRSEGTAPNEWNWALNSKIVYHFAGTDRTAEGILPITWYDGASKPPADVVALLEGDDLPDTGSIFVGTQGAMVLPHYSRPTVYPKAKFKDYEYPDAGEANHWGQFVKACQGEGKTTADFTYSGPLTETILLGGIASRFPQTTLRWDSASMKFTLPEANQYIRRDYRHGWKVNGLS
ncbi:MAG TPA: Gfo/Idh/MocA family oxidoreductase [Dongiaceae bacterium]|jgi:predicted dehydrogenase|nr:Gfo/Idh/MocA family oxidoreductase [Dongiaceae bacterium]